MKPLSEEQALKRLAALCYQAEYCQGDMMKKMEQWGLADDACSRIIDYLVDNRYVDDSRYCRCFVEDKIRYNGWGRRKIEQALYAKQVSASIYRPILDEVPAETYVDILRPMLAQKWRTLTGRNDYERSQKLIRFALGRGFDYDIIRRCIDGITSLPDD